MTESIVDMTFSKAIEVMKEWVNTEHNGKLKLDNPLDCPVQQWIEHNKRGCGKKVVPNTMRCPICDNPICSSCFSHEATQLSRVTGYISDTDGWNASKKQEFEDRTRTPISNFG